MSSNAELAKKLELEGKYDRQFNVVFDAIRQLMTAPEPKRKQIGDFMFELTKEEADSLMLQFATSNPV